MIEEPKVEVSIEDIERTLTEINGLLLLNTDIIVSNENFVEEVVKGTVTISKKLYKLSIDMYNFSKQVKDFVLNKIVSEKFIAERSGILSSTIKGITAKRAYVKNVPSFQEQRTRFLNLIKVVEYIEKAAHTPVESFPSGDSFIDNIVEISGGVFTITKPSEGSSFKNLKWEPPNLIDYEITQSPWASASNVEQVKALSLTCKYSMVEKLKNASIEIAKRCDKARKLYSNQMGSYDDEEDDMEHERLKSEVAAIYTLAYSVDKAIKQVMTQGLQKEINVFMNTYIRRLGKFSFE